MEMQTTENEFIQESFWTKFHSLPFATKQTVKETIIQFTYEFYLSYFQAFNVVDGGCALGRHTVPLAFKVGLRGKVFAYDPLPGLMDGRLSKVINYFDLGGRITFTQKALADKPGLREFTFLGGDLHKASRLMSSFVLSSLPAQFDAEKRSKIVVEVTCLDDELANVDNIRFMKLDLEGANVLAIKGARKLIKKHRPLIANEISAERLRAFGHTEEEVFDLFSELGYKLFTVFGHPIGSAKVLKDLPVFYDMIAVHSDDKLLQPVVSFLRNSRAQVDVQTTAQDHM